MEEFDTLFREWTPDKNWPQLTIPIAFQVIGPKVALARNDWTLCGNSVRDGERTINSDPYRKRDTSAIGQRDGAWCSRPWTEPLDGKYESLPYRKEFGMSNLEHDMTEVVMPDGEFRAVLNSLWGR
jgi:hypothetical protein